MSKRKILLEEITTAFHAIKNKMHAKMMHKNKGNITHSQEFALFTISQSKDTGIKEISKMLCTSSSAATQLVNELVKQGYVIRRTNSKDKRALHLEVSKKGHAQILKTKLQHSKIISSLFSSLTNRELKNFIALNKKILNNIL